MCPRSRLFSPNHKLLWVRCLVDASEPDLMVAIGLKASWPVSSGRDEDHVTAVRRDSRGIGKLTVALDASVTVHGQQVRCWDATSRRIRACHPNVDCTGAIGIGQEIVCDGNERDIVSIVAGNGFNAATVGLKPFPATMETMSLSFPSQTISCPIPIAPVQTTFG